jgi:hypothetical protein
MISLVKSFDRYVLLALIFLKRWLATFLCSPNRLVPPGELGSVLLSGEG